MREITIAGHRIADDTDAWTIAELGHNHGGSLNTCKQMISAAAEAGADAVKLQKRDNRTLYTQEAYDRPYDSENSFGRTYGEHREALEFDLAQYRKLRVEAIACDVAFMATAFDQRSADLLATLDPFPIHSSLGLAAFKIASNDVINLPLLKHVAMFGKPMIVSTGAASQQDVDRAINTIWPINQRLAILQCTAIYPVRVEHLNLNVITTYRERYPELVIGLSSHYSGISDAIAAYVLGARIFEKHFSLDRTSKGTDHPFSLEPKGFSKMVSYLRKVRLMMGSKDKQCLDEEMPAIEKMRKSTRWYQELYSDAIR